MLKGIHLFLFIVFAYLNSLLVYFLFKTNSNQDDKGVLAN